MIDNISPISHNNSPIAVLGAGAWGTALAMQLARNNQSVRLWTHDAQQAKRMAQTRCNSRYLPQSCRFPDAIRVYDDLCEALTGVKHIVIVVPSPAFCLLLHQIKPYLTPDTSIIWGSKGFPVLDENSLHKKQEADHVILLDDAINYYLEQPVQTAVLSGPSFAIEVAQNLPTAVVIASKTPSTVQYWSSCFHGQRFRVYGSHDMVGVELGGILKNIIAVAVGAAAGFRLGCNACSALITRGVAEMQRIGQALGAHPDTLIGLSGLGDLILTATSDKSRNYRFGFALGSGLSVEQAKAATGHVIESLNNVITLCDIAEAKHINLPIINQVSHLMQGKIQVSDALNYLLNRASTDEILRYRFS